MVSVMFEFTTTGVCCGWEICLGEFTFGERSGLCVGEVVIGGNLGESYRLVWNMGVCRLCRGDDGGEAIEANWKEV